MSNHILLLLLVPFPILILPLTTATNTLPAHTALSTYNFPKGLLPTPISHYTLNSTTGDFEIHFGKPCKITLPPDNYLAEYAKTVRGRIVENKIDGLDGIRVWAFFKWWGITGIKLSGTDLVFEVGLVTAKYPLDKFGVSPTCEGLRKADS